MADNTFNKESLVNSTGFSPMDRDILKIVLNDSDKYTLQAANRLISKFKGGIK